MHKKCSISRNIQKLHFLLCCVVFCEIRFCVKKFEKFFSDRYIFFFEIGHMSVKIEEINI
jgi:hypothetical protein